MARKNIFFLQVSVVIMLMACVFTVRAYGQEKTEVVFLNPGSADDAFFGMMTSFMQAAADDLGINLEVVYNDRDHLVMREKGLQILERDPLPEYMILINEKNGAVDLLSMAAERGVKVVLINEGLMPDDRQSFGQPGKTMPNWLFELLPDDRQAGYMLAQALIKKGFEAGMADEHGNLNMAGIAGTYQTGSSSYRVLGLQQAVREYDNVRLLQVVPAYWEEEKAQNVTAALLARYPETAVVWSASDVMARGVLVADDARERAHQSVLTGGIDWAGFALHEVKAGRFAATVGGHFMDGGWALVMLYDMHHGVALQERSMMSKFSLITQENVDAYFDRFGRHDWSIIDFTRFSKRLNPGLQQYSFGLDEVMAQLDRK